MATRPVEETQEAYEQAFPQSVLRREKANEIEAIKRFLRLVGKSKWCFASEYHEPGHSEPQLFSDWSGRYDPPQGIQRLIVEAVGMDWDAWQDEIEQAYQMMAQRAADSES